MDGALCADGVRAGPLDLFPPVSRRPRDRFEVIAPAAPGGRARLVPPGAAV